jgi:hypothetical protein
MVYQLLHIGKPVGAIAIVFLSTVNLGASSKEYIFTAPPEINRQIVKTPPSKTDYPFYECNSETVAKPEKATEATEANQALEIHDCNCQDCEDTLEKSELDPVD